MGSTRTGCTPRPSDALVGYAEMLRHELAPGRGSASSSLCPGAVEGDLRSTAARLHGPQRYGGPAPTRRSAWSPKDSPMPADEVRPAAGPRRAGRRVSGSSPIPRRRSCLAARFDDRRHAFRLPGRGPSRGVTGAVRPGRGVASTPVPATNWPKKSTGCAPRVGWHGRPDLPGRLVGREVVAGVEGAAIGGGAGEVVAVGAPRRCSSSIFSVARTRAARRRPRGRRHAAVARPGRRGPIAMVGLGGAARPSPRWGTWPPPTRPSRPRLVARAGRPDEGVAEHERAATLREDLAALLERVDLAREARPSRRRSALCTKIARSPRKAASSRRKTSATTSHDAGSLRSATTDKRRVHPPRDVDDPGVGPRHRPGRAAPIPCVAPVIHTDRAAVAHRSAPRPSAGPPRRTRAPSPTRWSTNSSSGSVRPGT